MNRYLITVFTLLILTISYSSAQTLEQVIPAGYHSPFLKSGQFIASVYYNSFSRKQEEIGINEGWNKSGGYNGNMVSYLGLTDKMTLTTKLFFYPKQNINWSNESGFGENSKDFNISPELTLSYRPSSALEIFGTFFYRKITTNFGRFFFYSNDPVGIDTTGNIIYKRQKHTATTGPDLNTEQINFQIGLTYSGKLW